MSIMSNTRRKTSTVGSADVTSWARDCVKNPSRYSATSSEARIVADLLAQAEREGNR